MIPIHGDPCRDRCLFASDRDLVEVDAFLSRPRYQRAAAAWDSGEEETLVRLNCRNGHCPTTVRTTSGPITNVQLPCGQAPNRARCLRALPMPFGLQTHKSRVVPTVRGHERDDLSEGAGHT
jgi:hypothetical protein